MTASRPSATPETLDAISSLAELGMRDVDIARSLEISTTSIVRWRARYGLPVGRDAESPDRPSRVGGTQLKGAERAAAAERIEQLAADGMSDRQIAALLSLTHRVVGHIRQDLGIESGGRLVPVVPPRLLRSTAGGTEECPACGSEVEMTGDRFDDHPPCPGSGLRPGDAP